MSDQALFATAPFEEGAGCACCGSREHATVSCPGGVAADLWTGHEETHEDAVDALREQYLATSNYVATWREADEWAREHAS